MESKGTKIIASLALLVAVCGVSIGFAAFSNTLTIKSSAYVTADDNNFDVNFSSSSTGEITGSVIPTITPSNVTGFTGETATIDNSDAPTITGLKANFTAPGQKVEYVFYAHNAGQYNAFLKSVVYTDVKTDSYKSCVAKEGTTQSLVDIACDDIKVTVKVAGDTFTGSNASISSHELSKGAFEEVKVIIEYKENTTLNIADGDFDVTFGDIALTYSSVN